MKNRVSRETIQQKKTAIKDSLRNFFIPQRAEILLILIQILIASPGLGLRTLWLDEAYSAILARKPFSQIHQALVLDAGPPLYYDLLKIWRAVFGESEVALRSMSLLFAVVTTLLLYRICLAFWAKKTALMVSWIWVLSPLSVAYATEARNYTLFAALSTAYIFCLAFFVVRYSVLGIAISLPCLILLLYTHNVGWFLVPVGLITTLIFTRNRWVLSFLAGSYLLAFLFYLPWVPTLLRQMKNTELTIGWVANVWSPTAIVTTFESFIPGGDVPVYVELIEFPFVIQIVNAIFLLFVILLAFNRWAKEKSREMTFLFLLFGFGLILPYLYSLFLTPVYLAGRTDFYLFPIWSILLGYGFRGIKHEHLRFALVSIFIFELILLNGFLYFKEDLRDERVLVEYLERHGKEGDVLLCTGLSRPPLEYYLDDEGFIFISYPLDMEDHLAHLNEEWYFEHKIVSKEAENSLHAALAALSENARLWLIGSDRLINRPLFDVLDQEPRLQEVAHAEPIRMGLRRLNEPLFYKRYEYVPSR